MKKKNRCPNEETLAAFVERLLSERKMAKVEQHLVHCSLCRDQVVNYAEAVTAAMQADVLAVPERVTQRAVDDVLGRNREPSGNILRHGAEKMIQSGLKVVEWFSPQPDLAAVVVRSGDATCTEPVVSRDRQFGNLHFLITLQKNEQQTVTIQVAWAKRPADGMVCRISLFRGDRESASSLLDSQPILFENMPFDVYTLVFHSSGKQIGEYRFEIEDD